MGRRDKDKRKQLKLQRETIRNLRDLPIDLLEGINGGVGRGGGGVPPSAACPTGP
ncbi:MAG TPA: hypothetical protein VMZ28_18360 [Kofleriaceae bacterium]|nr:hypothetical protein [Kofleriaceae bacterium]